LKKLTFVFISLAVFGLTDSFSQIPTGKSVPVGITKWTINNPGQTDVFVQNHGQYDYLLKDFDISLKPSAEKVQYVLNGNEMIFFTSQGYIWKLDEIVSDKSGESDAVAEKEIESNSTKSYFVNIDWEGANPNAPLIAEDEANGYYTYATEGYRELKAKGFKRLIYKNLYPGIDIVYVIPKESDAPIGGRVGKLRTGGIKYTIIVHPGADVKRIKMHYAGDFEKIALNSDGNIVVKTIAGELIDHAPESFYADTKTQVESRFRIERENCIGFTLPEDYDKSKVVIIDPWQIVPTIYGGTGVYDAGYDNSGNVYIEFAATNSYPQISKYDPSGNFLWTLNMFPISNYYSRFCVTPSGSIFLASGAFGGSGGKLDKVSNSGTLVDSVRWPAVFDYEGWVVNYNLCLNTFLIGGGGGTDSTYLRMGVDTSLKGTFTGYGFIGGKSNDMTTMRIDNNGDMYSYFACGKYPNSIIKFPAPYSTFAYTQARTGCIFGERTGIPVTGGRTTNRLNVMEINANYLFFFDGQNLEARSKATGNLLASIVVSASYTCGGKNYTAFYQNEGIAADDCNNVYVGGQGLVHVFNFNGTAFTTLASSLVPGNVYDISLDQSRGLLYVAGLNFVSTMAALPCGNGITITPSIIQPPCRGLTGSATVYVTGGQSPYSFLWSNAVTTNNITAIPGTYTVTITDASCNKQQTDTAIVTINKGVGPTVSVNKIANVCPGKISDGEITIHSTGTGDTYSWSNGVTSMKDSGLSVGAYTVTVTDGSGCTFMTSATIIQIQALNVEAGTSQTIDKGQSVQLFVNGGVTFQWTPSGSINDASSNRPVATPGVTTTYIVTAKDTNNCSATDSVLITVIDCDPKLIFVPNAFSPNGDGNNDVFFVHAPDCLTEIKLAVYDRWGELVFETTNPETGWNGEIHGKMGNAGVFTYYLTGELNNGLSFSKMGSITLLR